MKHLFLLLLFIKSFSSTGQNITIDWLSKDQKNEFSKFYGHSAIKTKNYIYIIAIKDNNKNALCFKYDTLMNFIEKTEVEFPTKSPTNSKLEYVRLLVGNEKVNFRFSFQDKDKNYINCIYQYKLGEKTLDLGSYFQIPIQYSSETATSESNGKKYVRFLDNSNRKGVIYELDSNFQSAKPINFDFKSYLFENEHHYLVDENKNVHLVSWIPNSNSYDYIYTRYNAKLRKHTTFNLLEKNQSEAPFFSGLDNENNLHIAVFFSKLKIKDKYAFDAVTIYKFDTTGNLIIKKTHNFTKTEISLLANSNKYIKDGAYVSYDTPFCDFASTANGMSAFSLQAYHMGKFTPSASVSGTTGSPISTGFLVVYYDQNVSQLFIQVIPVYTQNIYSDLGSHKLFGSIEQIHLVYNDNQTNYKENKKISDNTFVYPTISGAISCDILISGEVSYQLLYDHDKKHTKIFTDRFIQINKKTYFIENNKSAGLLKLK